MSYIIDAVNKVKASANKVLTAFIVAGDTVDRYTVDASGKQVWGSGSAEADTNLYRSAADTLKTDDALTVAGIFTPELGIDETVTTYTTTGDVVTYGTVVLSATAATTYNLPDPTIGVGLRIVSTTTNSQTVVMDTTNGVKFGTTGVSITFATPASATLMPVTATRWQIISSYSTGVAFA